jgi:hypothetical protein
MASADLPLRLTWILAVRIAFADLPVTTVKKQLPPVPTSDLSRRGAGFGLRSMNRPRPPISGDLHTPTLVARHDMHITLSHAAALP